MSLENVESSDHYENVYINQVGKFTIYKNDWIAEEIKNTGDWEPEFNDLFDKILHKNSNVIDVGAYVGTNTIKMARRSKHVYAFEPFSKTLELLATNIIQNDISNVSVFNLAVGNEHKIIDKMWYPIHNINYGCTRIHKNENSINTSAETNVQMIRLDDITLNEQVHLIKIDVEGCEEEVLQGGINLLKKYKPVVLIESWDGKIYDILISLDYKPIKLSHCNYLYLSKMDYCGLFNWTNDVPDGTRQNFHNVLTLFQNRENVELLEIGTFAGVSIIEMLKYLPNARGTVIDIWKDYPEQFTGMDKVIENAFHSNIKIMEMAGRVSVLKGKSRDKLLGLIKREKSFDIIYVDGSHFAFDCFLDLELSWELLNTGGVLIADDYLWRLQDPDTSVFKRPYEGVNTFLENHVGEYKVLVQNYRMFVQKL
jgi:FkbM family methyltransferase